ncbi:MAG: DUF2288 family protein [Bacteriovoracaceae bacterium]|jgi:hypothetical protein|nr:DUF2288 family protein [Bacteriovoracaceae bacterium]
MSEKENLDFTDQIEQADWAMLKPHVRRDALVVVSKDLELKEVALSVAKDESDKVKYWLECGLIYKPTEENVALWDQNKHQKMANFLIVSPFVLIQLL